MNAALGDTMNQIADWAVQAPAPKGS
jgi:hypothetical protein